jgi:hypothetical protein
MHERLDMSEKFDVDIVSRRQAFSLFGLAVALAPAMALGVSGARAQTPGMERREDRRDERQERREDRREDREDRREERRGLRDDQSEGRNEPAKEPAPK